jgi:type VI secretion system protein ImpA
VKRSPLTRSGLDWFQYKESRVVGTEEAAAAESEEKQRARLEAIADGKIPQEAFDKAFEESPKKFYVSLVETFDGTLESLESLGTVCDEKFGDVTPSFGTLKRALEEVRQTVYILLQAKREKEPDEPVAAPEPAAEAAYEEPAAQATGGAAAAPARARTGALSAEPVDREDAIGRVIAAAKFLRHEEPHSPAPFLMLRGLRWGELRAGGTEVNQMLLAAPPSEIRQNLKRLSLEANWTDVLEAAETAMGMECGRGWLDLQRYVGRACHELGFYYDGIRNGVISSLRALLADYPKLPELTMMDDTATANVETQAWLKENVLAVPEAAYTPGSYQQESSNGSGGEAGEPPPPDTFDLAMQAARQGRPQEGIQLLMREMVQERSGRGRFYRKVQLTKLCDITGYEAIAFPILQELAAEIERRKLEDWEAAELVAEPLALLHRCLSKTGGDAAEIQKLYSWICRLDPLQAMNMSR